MVITTKIYNVPSATYEVEHPDWPANHYYTLLYLCTFNLKVPNLSPDTDTCTRGTTRMQTVFPDLFSQDTGLESTRVG